MFSTRLRERTLPVRFLALLACLHFAANLPAQTPDVRMVVPKESIGQWPNWRGPSGQGLVLRPEKFMPPKYPDAWSDKDNILWKAPVPGQGNSSPCIWDHRLFLTTSYDKGQKRSFVCFDCNDGKKLWETTLPLELSEKVQSKNGWASSTCATDGRIVVSYFGAMGVFCVDREGKHLWHYPVPEMNVFHGTACSPLIYKDKVIVFQDQQSKTGSFVVALDKNTGKELWKTPRKEKVGWGSPIAISVDGKDQIIVSSQDRVYAYDPKDGSPIWSCGGNLYEVTPTPVVGHGLLFCCSGRVGPTLAIRPDGKGDITKSDKLVWKVGAGSPFIPSPILVGDLLYTVNDVNSVIRCFDAKTGKMHWSERCGEEVKHGFSASPVAVDDKLFFTNDDGDTFVLAAGTQFKVLHVNSIGERMLASPAFVGGRWFLRSEKHLWCVGYR